jgi:hypothetical protein
MAVDAFEEGLERKYPDGSDTARDELDEAVSLRDTCLERIKEMESKR